MIDIFLCHSAGDRGAAEQIAARLERCAEAKVWMEPLDPDTHLLDAWEGGLTAAGIVLMLGPDATPARLHRATWQPLLDHASAHARPPVACVLTAPCPYPKLLERTNFFYYKDEVEFLRAVERWTISLHEPAEGTVPFAPARLPSFAGRADETALLWRTLVDNGGARCTVAGSAGSGKSALAQEFARLAGEQFREVFWVNCGDASDASIVGDLAAQIGVSDARRIPTLVAEHRLLLVFDDLRRKLPVGLSGDGRSSIVVTTRDEAVAQGSVVRLRKLCESTPSAADNDGLQLWRALSACRRGAAAVDLAGRIAELASSRAEAALEALVNGRVVDRLDRSRVRVVHATAMDDTVRLRHAREVYAAFPMSLAELGPALEFACGTDWELARRLGQTASDWLRKQYRNAEAVEVLERLVAAAEKFGRAEDAEHFQWELSWLRQGANQLRRPVVAAQQLQLSFAM
ncbi:MAG TPA: NB-ARC domain-containing protein [Bryobacteraceae bacterium]|nr:NB-ARC domain-containing protein [Bryobacteraceae bacterium]